MNYVLITGASKGIGKNLAESCAKRGLNLILAARSQDLLQSLAENFTEKYKVDVKILAIDLAHPDAALEVYQWCTRHHYHVRILINNVGFAKWGKFSEIPLEDQMEMIQLNQLLTIKLCYYFIPQLSEMPNPHILNVASTAAFQPVPYFSIYGSVKSAVLSFTRALRSEVKKDGINATCLCPGPTESDFFLNAGYNKKALRDSKTIKMNPEQVAEKAIEGMFNKKALIVPGFSNKLGAYFSKHLSTGLVTKFVTGIFKP